MSDTAHVPASRVTVVVKPSRHKDKEESYILYGAAARDSNVDKEVGIVLKGRESGTVAEVWRTEERLVKVVKSEEVNK